MKKTLFVFCLSVFYIFTSSARAADKVVIIPLSGQKAIGDAVEEDVQEGKIFSNAHSIGLIGTRPPAPVASTGQTPTLPVTILADTTGDDGDLQKGIPLPAPRFTGNGDGTVTDHLTGLIWLANHNCLDTVAGVDKSGETLDLSDALKWSNNLESGVCGLTDNSNPGDWRLPNINEFMTLIDYRYSNPAMSNDANTGRLDDGHPDESSFMHPSEPWGPYKTSTRVSNSNFQYWTIDIGNGANTSRNPTLADRVWPVRDK